MSKMFRKKKVKRRRFLASSCPDLVIGARGTEEETKGEEFLQMMRKDIAYHEVHNNEVHNNKEKMKKEIRMEREAYNETAPHEEGRAASHKEIHVAPHEEGHIAPHEEGRVAPREEIHVAPREEIHRVPPAGTVREEKVRAEEVQQEKVQQEKVQQEDELKIRGTRIADSLLMQLEDEVIGIINRRLEEHVAKRIKGVLVPVAKLSLKVQRIRKKLTSDAGVEGEKGDTDVKGVKADAGVRGDKSNKDKGDKEGEADKGGEAAARHLLDLEDDLDYILENSKLKRISPQVGERFNPNLHEEVDFSWNPDREELEILATCRDGFFWEYNQEMILKPQVVVNRRLSA
jgi:hypothetical protein